MSFSKTSIFCLILLMVFIAAPAMAHQGNGPKAVFDRNHDGISNDNPNQLDSNETDHEHHEATPKVTSIAALDTQVGSTATVMGAYAKLIDDASATTPVLTVVDASTGQFRIQITFDKDVVDGPTADTTLSLGTDDFLISAARSDALSVNLNPMHATDRGNNDPIRILSVAQATADSKKVYNVTIQVQSSIVNNVLGTSSTDPAIVSSDVHVWLTLVENAAYTRNGSLVGGVPKFGRGSQESKAFEVILTSETTLDATPPTLTISHDPADNTKGDMVTFKFSFNERLGQYKDDALDVKDITITNGDAGKLSAPVYTPADATKDPAVPESTVYTLPVTLKDKNTNVTVELKADTVKDLAGNAVPASTVDAGSTFIPDNTGPVLTITHTATATNVATFTFSFGEAPATSGDGRFTAADINVDANGKKGAFAPATAANTWTLIVTPKDAAEKSKNVVVSVKADSVTDTAGNAFTMAAEGNNATFKPDNKGPVLKITHSPADGRSPTASKVTFTFSFNETLGTNALDDDDITVVENGNPGTLSTASVDGGKTTYTLDVTLLDQYKPVTVSVTKDSVIDKAGNKFTLDAKSDATFTPLGILMLSKESYTVVVRKKIAHTQPGASGLNFPTGTQIVEWADMPDLSTIFTGNARKYLILKPVKATGYTEPGKGTVGISEIMWGIDVGYKIDKDVPTIDSQWIELHNLNKNPVTVQLTTSDTADGDATDQAYYGTGAAPGQNGDSVNVVRKPFISMYRAIPHAKPNYGVAGAKYSDVDGTTASNWKSSEVKDKDKLRPHYSYGSGHIGTPGKLNTHHTADTRSNVPGATDGAFKIVINEVANRQQLDKDYEWIELRNISGSTINLNNYRISMLRTVPKGDSTEFTDASFINLPNMTIDVPDEGVLLLVASNPRGNPDHPLAVGYDVGNRDPYDQVLGLDTLGISNTSKHGRYLVVDFGGTNNDGSLTHPEGLPDDGDFVLVLRRADNLESNHGHADKGRAELGTADLDRIEDLAGYLSGTQGNNPGYSNPASNTGLWPLKSFPRARFSRNSLKANVVQYRHRVSTNKPGGGVSAHDDKNDGHAAYTTVGYTGIGYKRQIPRNNIYGGTPGYHDVERSKSEQTNVIISELMLSQGPESLRVKLPQWIELYNPSDYAVQLDAGSGWRLEIETSLEGKAGEPIRTINFKARGAVKRILPKQTILIVSAHARSYGSDTLPTVTAFPATRVFNVYKELKDHFSMDIKGRNSMMVNPDAFHIVLKDNDGYVSDTVGNLDGNPRTSDTAKWKFPKSLTKDDYRSSLIRIHDDGVPRNGHSLDKDIVKPLGGTPDAGKKNDPKGISMEYSWVHAADTDFVNIFVRHTWYGNENDFGTPANRAGQVLPVELSSFRPTLEDGKVVVRWTTESELDNAGFNIYRSETRNGEFKQVNAQLIQGAGTTGERNVYKWVDTTAKPDVVYYYQIEDVSFSGERQTLAQNRLKGYVSAKNKLTTRWGELKKTLQ